MTETESKDEFSVPTGADGMHFITSSDNPIFPDFSKSYPDFSRIFPDFDYF